MQPERYARLTDLVQAALEKDGPSRAAFLASIAADDAAMAAEVASLVSAADDPSNPFTESHIDQRRSALCELLDEKDKDALASLPLPERVGDYRVLRLIGAGGMGVVFEAEVGDPPRRVALKMLRPGAVDASLQRRFAREAKILGELRHDGIASIYETGVDGASSLPYIAMELVSGVSIDRFVHDRRLSTADRVALFSRVCDAIEHAHQHGVVHRDLKPDNILVDDDANPKVLDFGVARHDGIEALTLTRTGDIVGTLAYMSPEQLTMDGEITPASDVFSLGAILYELLAERAAYDVAKRPLSQVARIICKEDPTPVSRIRPDCGPGLDAIIAGALTKEPSRRYPTAGALGADLTRYLNGEPIARAESSLRGLSRLISRGRGLLKRGQTD